MAAQAFKLYNTAKKKLMSGTVNISGTSTWRIALVQSASNFATATLSLFGSITNEVANGNGYTTGASNPGRSLASEGILVSAGASSKAPTWKFSVASVIYTATGGNIANIKAAVIYWSNATTASRHLLCYASLTSGQFTLASGNQLTITMPTAGLFTIA